MNWILIFTIMIMSGILSAQQVDTSEIKAEIAGLNTFEDQLEYIHDIYFIDQTHRGDKSNDSIDFRNLIAISYFINAYGYPKFEDHGRYSAAPNLIWTHNRYHEVDRVTFPIILRGFLSEEIREKDLRLNFLRGLYHRKYDDENYRRVPLKELFTICEVSLDSTVSVKEVLEKKAEIDSFNRIPIINETIWRSEDRVENYALASGKLVERTFDGETIRIFAKENGKTYLLKDHIDNSGEPRELEEMAEDTYKYSGQETTKFFKIDNDRLLFGDSLLVFKAYMKKELTEDRKQ